MSKRAEAVSLEAYPPTYTTVKRRAKRVQSERVDTHQQTRAIFQQGYEQAEIDMIAKAKQWIIRQRGFSKMALLDFQKFMEEE